MKACEVVEIPISFENLTDEAIYDKYKDLIDEFNETERFDLNNINEFKKFVDDKKGKKSKRFLGHEGISAFMVIDILNKTDLSTEDKIKIFQLIALHGSLFHYIKTDGTIKADINKTFEGNGKLLEDLTHQVRADSFGRWADIEKVSDHDLLFVQRLPEHFVPFYSSLGEGVCREVKPHNLTLLVGPPCSFKSTWVEKNKGDAVVISRDALVESVGVKYGINNYSDAFSFLLKNPEIEEKEVTNAMQNMGQTARKNKQSVIIDMTNMSKKSRKKWLNQFEKDYNKKVVLFLTGYDVLVECNAKRGKETGKKINEPIVLNMVRSFSLPMYGEGIDSIEYQWN